MTSSPCQWECAMPDMSVHNETQSSELCGLSRSGDGGYCHYTLRSPQSFLQHLQWCGQYHSIIKCCEQCKRWSGFLPSKYWINSYLAVILRVRLDDLTCNLRYFEIVDLRNALKYYGTFTLFVCLYFFVFLSLFRCITSDFYINLFNSIQRSEAVLPPSEPSIVRT